jgi:hypothetical protein
MSDRARVKRPEPSRTQPIRNWSTLFDPAGRFTPPGFPGQAEPGPRPSSPADPVSRGVEAGYRVMEEYMRQGQNVARMMWAPYGGNGAPPADEMQQRMGAMFRQATDLAMMWLDMAGMGWMGGMGGRPPTAPGSVAVGPFPTGGEPPAPAPVHDNPGRRAAPQPERSDQTAFTIEVESARRTEVSIDLRPRSAELRLRVPDLRASDPLLPRLTDVTIEGAQDEDRVRVCIRVPPDQPPGIYSGIILDERTSLPRGTLSVRVAPS